MNTFVFSQLSVFELKDCPSSITYHSSGSSTHTTTFSYDTDKRLIEIENGLEYEDLTVSYSKSGDTTIILTTYKADDGSEEEPETILIKQLHDSQGRAVLEIMYEELQPIGESRFYYNANGDLIRKVDVSGNDSLTYEWEWDMTALLVSEIQLYEEEIWSYTEYQIDNNKKIIKSIYFNCEDNSCEETGTYAILNYNASSIKMNPVTKKMALTHRSGNQKIYTVNGRAMTGNNRLAPSLLIVKREGKPLTQLNLK